MDEIIEIVAGSFGYTNFETEVLQKKLSYLLKTQDETLLIKRNFTNKENILRQFYLQNLILDKGYKNLSRLLLNEENEPFCAVDDEFYTLQKNISKNEISLDDKQEISLAIEELANFHKNTKNLVLAEEFKKISTFDFGEIEEMEKIKRKINKFKKKTEFDIYVLKNYDKYIQRAKKIINILETSNYISIENNCISNCSITLNLIKEEQFMLKDNYVIINSLCENTIGYQLDDLIKFIHRYLQKNIINKNLDFMKVEDLINIYSSINPIDDLNLKIVKAKLLYPTDFFKLVKKHYEKHRGWTLGVISTKIKELEDIDNVYVANLTDLT